MLLNKEIFNGLTSIGLNVGALFFRSF
jgi:hypothetical protein